MQPSKLQLALALTVIKSKPSSFSVREYIQQLRDHSTSGSRPQFSATYEESQQHYINAALYYKALSEKSNLREEELENKLAKAQREAEQLRAEIIAKANDLPPSKKRRREKDNDDGRKSIVCHNCRNGQEQDNNNNTSTGIPSDQGRVNDNLLRHMYYLTKTFQSDDYEPEHLARLLGNVTCSASKLIAELRHKLPLDLKPSFEEERQHHIKILQAYRISLVPLVMQASQCLQDLDHSGRHTGAIAYQTLLLCKSLISYLTAVAKQLGTENSACNSKTKEYSDDIRTMTNLVIRILTCIIQTSHQQMPDSQDQVHSSLEGPHKPVFESILQGVLHLSLNRAGALLYTLTFKTSFSSAGDPSPSSTASANELAAARLEAQYLTPVLRKLLPGSAHARFLVEDPVMITPPPSSRGTSSGPTANAKTRNNHDIAASSSLSLFTTSLRRDQKHGMVGQPLDRIQNTLMTATFGDGGAGRFTDAIRPTSSSMTGANDEQHDEVDLGAGMRVSSRDNDWEEDVHSQDGTEDFVKEMWCRVGWDVLARGFETV